MSELGRRPMLIAAGPSATTILLSHLHWDHLQGLPFFTPVYVSGNWIEVVSGPNGVMPLEAALRRQRMRWPATRSWAATRPCARRWA